LSQAVTILLPSKTDVLSTGRTSFISFFPLLYHDIASLGLNVDFDSHYSFAQRQLFFSAAAS
jgi:hypothetical protein